MSNNPPPVSPGVQRLYVLIRDSKITGLSVYAYEQRREAALARALARDLIVAELSIVDGHVVDMREVTA